MSAVFGVDWANRLAKWRMVLTGWQVGTRPRGDPTTEAIRDHREVTLLMRAELNAIVQILIHKKICTPEEFGFVFSGECELLCRVLEKKFPGAKANDSGMDIDVTVAAPWLSEFPK